MSSERQQSSHEGRIELSIGIVSYNTADSLVQCLRSIIDETPTISYEVIVVDNDSDDASAERAREAGPQVAVVCNRQNRGFAVAMNQALRAARGEYFLMLNPDSLARDQALERSLCFLRGYSRQTAMTCNVLSGQGKPHRVVRGPGFSDLRAQLLMQLRLERLFSRAAFMRRALLRDFDFSTVSEIRFAPGCFVMLHTEFLRRLGGLDEQFALYGEDHDLCLRIYDAGGRILYYPGAVVVHVGGESSRSIGLVAHEQLVLSRYLFDVKHFGAPKARALGAIRCLGAVVDLLRLARNSLINRKAADHAMAIRKANFTMLWFLGLRSPRPLPQRLEDRS